MKTEQFQEFKCTEKICEQIILKKKKKIQKSIHKIIKILMIYRDNIVSEI